MTRKKVTLRNDPLRDPELLLARAMALHKAGEQGKAQSAYRAILAIDPRHPATLALLGTLYLQRGKAADGIKHLELSLAINPHQPDAYNNLGNAFKKLGFDHEALASYEQAIKHSPTFAAAQCNRGAILKKLKRLDEALASYGKAISAQPDYVRAYNNRGNILNELGRHDEALADYDKAIALQPDSAVAHTNRGNTLSERGRYDEAILGYDIAAALDPDYADTHLNRGVTLQELKRYAEAIASYERAISLRPDYAEAHFGIACVKLMQGEWGEGWKLYEWRWKKDDMQPHAVTFRQPLWLGKEKLAGKTILLHAEQGFGDAIQFCRYVPIVEALGARVIVEVPAALHELIATVSSTARFVAKGDALPKFDFHTPLMSLPLAFKTMPDTIPAKIPYLFVLPEKQKEWRQRLGSKTKPRIGLAWAGSGKYSNKTSFKRDIPFAEFQPIIDLDYDFFCLHKEIRSEDKELLLRNARVKTFTDELNDFTDTAALIAEMDLVIAVDTAVGHVAGALGKPLWLLLSDPPELTSIIGREDSPWYPAARLFRQSSSADWGGVIEVLIKCLHRYEINSPP